MTSSQNTVPVSSVVTQDGHTIVASDFDNFAYLVIEPGAAKEEIVKVTGISGSSFTGATRGLAFYGGTETSVPANQFAHQSGSTVIMSNVQYYYDKLVDLDSAEIITGIKTFASGATPLITDAPLAANQAANKAYVDITATGSATYDQNIIPGTAGENVSAGDLLYFKTSDQKWWKAKADAAATSIAVRLGFAQATVLANAAVNMLINGINKNNAGLTPGSAYYVSGSTGGALSTTPGTFVRFVGWAQSATSMILDSFEDPTGMGQLGQEIYGADTVGTDAYAINLVPAITAYKDGMIINFKAGTANTGNATLSINGLTAKNILKNYNLILQNNDILAGQILTVVYDGTQDAFQMQSMTSVQVVSRFGGSGVDGALSIAAGTTTIDLGNAAVVTKNYSSISITGTGQLAFSNPNSAGTIIILKCTGNVTITSTANPAIDLRGLGAAGSTGGASNTNGNDGTVSSYILGSDSSNGKLGEATNNSNPSNGGAAYTLKNLYTLSTDLLYRRSIVLTAGSGAGSGGGGGNGTGTGGAGGNGGRGAGALYVECAGAFNFTSANGINASGSNGTNGSPVAGGSGGGGGAGGGGAGGFVVILYNILTANTGVVAVNGGNGGSGGAGGSATSGGQGGGGGGMYNGAGGRGGGGSGNNAGTNGSNGSTGGTGGTAGTAGLAADATGGPGGGGTAGEVFITQNTIFA